MGNNYLKDMKKDNCIVFDDIASFYDETRPFIPSESKVFLEISKILLEKFSESEEIFVLDAGTGTGRLALKFAEAYQTQASILKSNTILKLYCVDKSEAMLSRFKEKISWDITDTTKTYSTNVHILIDEKDIRDITIKDNKYDVIIAHWIFHTIFDWSTALYSLTQLISKNGVFITFEEDSDLYNAIDGDYDSIGNNVVKKFWEQYHNFRKNTLNQCYIPARNRIGSRVKDKRIDTLLNSLGWINEANSDQKSTDSWSITFTLDEITKNIIEKRAFTNMRFTQNIDGSDFINSSFYNILDEQLYKPNGTSPNSEFWTINFTFKYNYYFFQENKEAKEYRTLLNLVKSTIGKKNTRKLDIVYNPQTFWNRIFDLTWSRINYSTKEKHSIVFGLIPDIEIEQISFAYAKFSNEITKNSNDFRAFDEDKIILSTIWNNLTTGLEVYDPIIISFNDFKFPIDYYSIFNQITIDSSKIDKLKDASIKNRRVELTDLLNKSEDLKRLIKNIENIGLLPFNMRDSMFAFFNGITDIVKIGDIRFVYLFPYNSPKYNNTLGLMLLCKNQLSHKAFDYINLLFDTLLNEYIDEISE